MNPARILKSYVSIYLAMASAAQAAQLSVRFADGGSEVTLAYGETTEILVVWTTGLMETAEWGARLTSLDLRFDVAGALGEPAEGLRVVDVVGLAGWEFFSAIGVPFTESEFFLGVYDPTLLGIAGNGTAFETVVATLAVQNLAAADMDVSVAIRHSGPLDPLPLAENATSYEIGNPYWIFRWQQEVSGPAHFDLGQGNPGDAGPQWGLHGLETFQPLLVHALGGGASRADGPMVAPDGPDIQLGTGPCGCMDLVFVVDDTAGMAMALGGNLRAELQSLIDLAWIRSNGDLRLGLITFKDNVTVVHALTTNVVAVRNSINALAANGGGNNPQASDEAIREMLKETACSSTGDFSVQFRHCIRQALLVTRGLPGGCDDYYARADRVNARTRAIQAATKGIRVSAVIPGGAVDPRLGSLMQNYAEMTGGVYATIGADGSGLASALLPALDSCPDCNGNGVSDPLDIAGGTSADCNVDAVPDECNRDCNATGQPDACDVALGTSLDIDQDDIPDECALPTDFSLWFVDGRAMGAENGTSWEDAFTDLQDALAAAEPACGATGEIWVAAGRYMPTKPLGVRAVSYHLKSGVEVYGGFAGNETSREQRQPKVYVTTLSGDLGEDDVPALFPEESTYWNNSYHVVVGSGTDETAILDGFTVTEGIASGTGDNQYLGGGMYINAGSPTVRNCTFLRNQADFGGGLIAEYSSNPTITNCMFSQNLGGVSGGAGGGIFVQYASAPTIVNCLFTDNEAAFGGAIDVWHADTTLINCTFSGNNATGKGGALEVSYYPQGPEPHASSATLSNCILWGNSAPMSSDGPELANGYLGQAGDNPESTITVDHSDIAGGSAQVDMAGGGTLNWDGLSNLTAEPVFAGGGDFRLAEGSTCIDAGANAAIPTGITSDLDGNLRIVDGDGNATATVDLGAYEFFVEQPEPDHCPDCNLNGIADDEDIAAGTSADINNDGVPDECPPNIDPGVVPVMGEPPLPVIFTLPLSCPYQFGYDPARVKLWDTPSKNNLLPPDATFVATSRVGDIEPDCDVDLRDFAAFQRCFTGAGVGPPGSGCGLFNLEADTDVDLDDFGPVRASLSGPGVCAKAAVRVYVEGLTGSSALADTQVVFKTDCDVNGVFITDYVQSVTVASVTISPNSGRLGTQITVTVQPAIGSLAFDACTTAEWTGVFDPVSGPVSGSFTVMYNSTQVHESGPGTTVLVMGDGAAGTPPDAATSNFPGSLDGVLTLHFGTSLSRAFYFTPSDVPAVWESIRYLDSSTSGGPPVLNGEPSQLPIMILSSNPNPIPAELVLLNSYQAHLAVVLRIAENPTTAAYPRAFIDVELVAFDASGIEIDRVQFLRLTRFVGNDGEPTSLVYHSDLSKPVILVDVALDRTNYPNVVLLRSQAGATVRIIPRLP